MTPTIDYGHGKPYFWTYATIMFLTKKLKLGASLHRGSQMRLDTREIKDSRYSRKKYKPNVRISGSSIRRYEMK